MASRVISEKYEATKAKMVMHMQRKILIPIEPVQTDESVEMDKHNEDELASGFILAVIVWTFVFSNYSINPVQFLVDLLMSELTRSGVVVNVFALIGMVFTLQYVPWIELFEQICRLHLRLLIGFPWVVLLCLLKCILDIAHSYWCVFAPQSTMVNPDYKFLEHPMERK